MIVLIAAWLVGCGFLAWHLWHAPEGYQARDGFHYGEEHRDYSVIDDSDAGSWAESLLFEPWASARRDDGTFVRGGRVTPVTTPLPAVHTFHGDDV